MDADAGTAAMITPTDERPASPGEHRALLEVAGVSKRFGRQLVLDDFAIEVRPGEVHGLVGHNGSGKSTFVKILAGFHQPEPGSRAAVDGAEFTVGQAKAADALGLRFVHQDLGLVQTLDAVDNLALGQPYPMHRMGRINWRVARTEAAELLASLGYDFDLRTPVGRLSLADRTGLAIARVLRPGRSPARVIVLDEPTAALPADSVRELFEVIARLSASGIAILYISHHLEEVFEIAGRVTVLQDGRKVTTRATSGLTERELVDLMVGRVEDLTGQAELRDRRPGRVVLEVRQLSAGALRSVDLSVCAGEIVGVAGVAGSGRDDLAGALYGSAHRSGEVCVNGVPVPELRPDASIKLGMGLLPSDRLYTGLVPRLSVRENLTLPRLNASGRGLFLNRWHEARECLDWLDRLAVQPRDPGRKAELLSGGNQQKVMLARWLRAAPGLLILDEPTQGVDVGAIQRIHAAVREHAAEGTALLVCSSDAGDLAALCDRVVVLRRGVIAAELRGTDINRDSIDRLCLQDPGNGVTER